MFDQISSFVLLLTTVVAVLVLALAAFFVLRRRKQNMLRSRWRGPSMGGSGSGSRYDPNVRLGPCDYHDDAAPAWDPNEGTDWNAY